LSVPESAISVRDVHKTFVLRNAAIGSLKTLLLWWRRRDEKRLHVLRGVSFEVNRGECVAIVGRNGAGKSTLLALLARVYRPTSGAVVTRGRVAPLLELGAGFHPDLSGAENVQFNSIILGLTRKEAKERFQAIWDFSELGDHIWDPVRTYSSGMLARLGFSVAVHVDAEILLVDEVLAVGDYEFQQKCYERIRGFRAGGGTILLVSHQDDTVRQFADRCIWIQHGEILREGPPDEVLADYEAHSEAER
jgi:lipopolysaccharide transport system ATP-binding protein